MYQLITSPMVNAPPSSYILKLLHNSRTLYVPQNGHRSEHNPHGSSVKVTDTKEDMMEIFGQDFDGRPRDLKRLMNRRNYIAVVAYDPQAVVHGPFGGHHQPHPHQQRADQSATQAGKLNLAVDFMVQGDAGAAAVPPNQAPTGYAPAVGSVVKYGPVVVPSLEFGR